MDYKLIALDIDGTLTNSQKEITPRTRYALMEAQKQGKKIILASGRHPVGIMPIAKDLMLDRFGGFFFAVHRGRGFQRRQDYQLRNRRNDGEQAVSA